MEKGRGRWTTAWARCARLLRRLAGRSSAGPRADIEREIDEELDFHLEMRTRENIAAGMSAREARRRAAERFGEIDAVRRRGRRIRRREAGLVGRLLHDLWYDARHAMRMMIATPALSVPALLALCLGVGATTAVFSVIDGVMLQGLPYDDAGGIVIVRSDGLRQDTYRLWEEQLAGIEKLGFYSIASLDLTGVPEPRRISTMPVSEGFFAVFGVAAAQGRTLVEGDYEAGAAPVVVITDRLWRVSFGADPQLLGSRVLLDGRPFTVVGIMPPEFTFLYYYGHADIWVPLSQVPLHGGMAIGRLSPGATIERVELEVATLEAQLDAEPLGNGRPNVVGLRDGIMENDRPSLQMAAGAAALVLLIACANVANLLLSRAFSRRDEIAMRGALGAAPGRIARQLLTESTLLSLLGGGLGVALARAALPAILALSPTYLPRQDNIAIDLRVLAFALLTCAITGLLFGLAPVLFTRSGGVRSTSGKAGGASASRAGRRTLQLLIIGEVAVALVLVVGTGLLLRTFLTLRPSAPGFDADGKLTFEVRLPERRYRDAQSIETFFAGALEQLRGLPGVADAAVISNLPMVQTGYVVEAVPEGADPDGDRLPRIWYERASANYLELMGIPLLRGQSLAAASGPPMVVSEYAARTLWPNSDPIGKRLSVQAVDGPRDYVVVGVAADTRRFGSDTRPRTTVWARFADHPDSGMTFVVQARGDPALLVPSVRELMGQLDADLPLSDVQSMDAILFESVSLQRFYALLMSAFGTIALSLAAIGFYGVMAFVVGRRRHELGVRLALGAAPRSLLGMVLREGLTIVSIGAGIGLLGAFGFTRLLESRIYGVQGLPGVDFVLLVALVVAVGVAATLVPALRAMRADPVTTLRQT